MFAATLPRSRPTPSALPNSRGYNPSHDIPSKPSGLGGVSAYRTRSLHRGFPLPQKQAGFWLAYICVIEAFS